MKRVTLEEIGKKRLTFHVPKTVVIDGCEMQATLKVEYELDFEEGVGCGGTCLVYHAYKIVEFSGAFLKHKVILKEFYPELETEDETIVRHEDGSLEISDAVKEQEIYRTKFERFRKSYEMFVNLHNEKRTNNYVSDADSLIEANGTWYLTTDYNEACTLSEYLKKQPNLYEFCFVLKRVAEAVSILHDAGYLHLDLTPGNIMVFPDGQIRLLDTDSFLKIDEINSKRPVLSWSAGYAAPELLGFRVYQRLSLMGERSDIFSIGAIMYRYLYEKHLEGKFDKESLSGKIEEKYALHQNDIVKCPQNAVRRLEEFLSIALSEEMACRYETMKEVAEILEAVLPLIEPKRIQVLDNFRKNSDRVYGREEKVRELETAFAEQGQQGRHRQVLIHGIGGIGKSTLARAYAEKHLEQYEVIVEVSEESAEGVVKSIGLVNYDGNVLGEKLKLLQTLLQEKKCLLIVHDYNQREDESFALFKKLPCDVILTSWADWKESGICCITLKSSDLPEQAAIHIFQEIYLKNAQTDSESLKAMLEEEREALKLLLYQVEYHPLAIKLLAKQMSYLAGAEQTPSQMLVELEECGIWENQKIIFQNQKDDGSVELGNIFFHLQKIYGTALQNGKLTEEELEVLRYMMLLSGENGVCRERFVFWTGLGDDAFVTLFNLYKKGWLEYEPEKEDELWIEAKNWNYLTFRKDFEPGEMLRRMSGYQKSEYTIGTYRMPMGIAQVLCRQKKMRSTLGNSEILIQTFYEMILFSGSIEHYSTTKLLMNFVEKLYRCIEIEEKREYIRFLSNYGRIVCRLEISTKNQRKHAIKAVEKAAQIRSRFLEDDERGCYSFYESMSYVYFYTEQYEKAVHYCEKALKVVPDEEFEQMFLYGRLADSYLAMGEYKEAEKYIQKCPSDWRLGKVEELKGNYFAAIEYWELAREQSMNVWGNVYTMEVAKFDFELASCYWKCGRRTKAIEHLERCVAAYEKFYGPKSVKSQLVREQLGKYQKELKNL